MKELAAFTKVQLVVFLISILIMSGCASGPTGSVIMMPDRTNLLSQYKTLGIEVASEPNDAPLFVQSVLAPLEKSLVEEIQKIGVFTEVFVKSERPDASSDLLLKVIRIDYETAQGEGYLVARLILLGMGSRYKLVIEASLHDTKTGKVVGKYKVEGKSGSILKVSLSVAIEQTAMKLAESLRVNM